MDTTSAALVPALLVTCVLALASGLVACGGSADSETPPTVHVVEDEPLPVQRVEAGQTVPMVYDTLDTTGVVDSAGEYAILTTAGDTSSAIGNFGARPIEGVELRIHPTDADGTDRTAFYDTVSVGDTLDFRTRGIDCGFRYRISGVQTSSTLYVFGLADANRYDVSSCGGFVDDPGAARNVAFIWNPATGYPIGDGQRAFMRGEPADPGTYRVDEDLPFLVTVPEGGQVIYSGYVLAGRPDGSDLPSGWFRLTEAHSKAEVVINGETGAEMYRYPAEIARQVAPGGLTTEQFLDALVASVRRIDSE